MAEMARGRDAEIAALVCGFNGRFPTRQDRTCGPDRRQPARGGANAAGARMVPRWIRWNEPERLLSVGIGFAFEALEQCSNVFVYIPSCQNASILIFGGENAPAGAGAELEAVANRAAEKQTPINVLIDQIVEAVERCECSADSDYHRTKYQKALSDFSDILAFASKNGKTLDLLICLAVAANRSFRRVTIFDPFPDCFMDSTGAEDFRKLDDAMQNIPAINQMASKFSDTSSPTVQNAGLLLRFLMDMKGVIAKDELAMDLETLKKHSIDGPNVSISNPVFELQLEHGHDPEFEAAFGRHESMVKLRPFMAHRWKIFIVFFDVA
eukprot:747419-Hanusia_phi.AAC.13